MFRAGCRPWRGRGWRLVVPPRGRIATPPPSEPTTGDSSHAAKGFGQAAALARMWVTIRTPPKGRIATLIRVARSPPASHPEHLDSISPTFPQSGPGRARVSRTSSILLDRLERRNRSARGSQKLHNSEKPHNSPTQPCERRLPPRSFDRVAASPDERHRPAFPSYGGVRVHRTAPQSPERDVHEDRLQRCADLVVGCLAAPEGQ